MGETKTLNYSDIIREEFDHSQVNIELEQNKKPFPAKLSTQKQLIGKKVGTNPK